LRVIIGVKENTHKLLGVGGSKRFTGGNRDIEFCENTKDFVKGC